MLKCCIFVPCNSAINMKDVFCAGGIYYSLVNCI